MLLVKIKLVFDRKNEVTSPKTKGKIDFYIYDPATKRKLYVASKVSVLATQFEQTKGEVGKIIKHPNAVALNGELNRLYRGIEDFTLSDRCSTIDDIKEWDTKVGDKTLVVQFIKDELARRKPSDNVVKRHNGLIIKLEHYGKIVKFTDLTYENLVGFHRFLCKGNSEVQGISEVTAENYHKAFRSYVREAINLGLYNYNPYITFQPPKGKSKDPVFLTESELKILANYDLTSKTQNVKLAKIKDVFVFQCYTALSYIDLKSFDKSKIIVEGDYKIIRSNRRKTNEEYITVLLPEAIEILKRYDYNLPVPSNQKYNEYLKALMLYIVDKEGNMLIQNKKISSHVARHTCAMYLLNKGVPLETVAKVLGHADVSMTRRYAKLQARTVINDIAKHVINA